jgi:GntR family transcriptional regulator
MPTPDEIHILDIASGVPVIDYTRTAYTTGQPVRVTKTIFAGDRNRLVFEIGDLGALYEEPADADLASNTE